MLKKIAENNPIALSLVLFLALSFIFLSIQGWRQMTDPQRGNWWSVSFDAPESVIAFDFTIENHSVRDKFHWSVFSGNRKMTEGEIVIRAGEMRSVRPEISVPGGKISISVSDGESRREIYKVLP